MATDYVPCSMPGCDTMTLPERVCGWCGRPQCIEHCDATWLPRPDGGGRVPIYADMADGSCGLCGVPMDGAPGTLRRRVWPALRMATEQLGGLRSEGGTDSEHYTAVLDGGHWVSLRISPRGETFILSLYAPDSPRDETFILSLYAPDSGRNEPLLMSILNDPLTDRSLGRLRDVCSVMRRWADRTLSWRLETQEMRHDD